MCHHVYYRALGDRLFLAPIDLDGKRVLDIGTGTGIWAMQLGMLYIYVNTVPPDHRNHY